METFTVYGSNAKEAAYEARTQVGSGPSLSVKRLAEDEYGTPWLVTVKGTPCTR